MQAANASSWPPVTNRERRAWYFYDFGNSAYAAVILLAVYSAYFKNTVVGGEEGTRLWGVAAGLATLFVALTSPILGSIADYSASKKSFLFFFTALCCACTALLFLVQKGDVVLGMAFFILAEIGYRSGQVFQNAFLPELATPAEIERVSGNGWAIGSAGGIICLLLVLPLIVLLEKSLGALIVRVSFIITALFFVASVVPAWLWLKERAVRRSLPAGQSYLSLGFGRIWHTLQHARHYREFLKFTLAFIIFNNGIIIAIDFAAIIGSVLFGMNQTSLIVLIIVVQVTSVIGAYLFGIFASRNNSKLALLISLVLMILAVIWLYFARTAAIFYVIGALAGLALTGVQSISRTMVGQLSPMARSGEFYGLFAVASSMSAFIGPTLFGIISAAAARRYMAQGLLDIPAEQAGLRVGILGLLAFLAVGSALLLLVNLKRGQQAAQTVITV